MYERYKDDFKTYANKTTRRQYDDDEEEDWLPTGTAAGSSVAEDRDDPLLGQDIEMLETEGSTPQMFEGSTPQMFHEKGVITNEETPRAESSFGGFGW